LVIGDGAAVVRRRLGWGILLGVASRGEPKEVNDAKEAVDAARGEGAEGEGAIDKRLDGRLAVDRR